MTRIKICGLYRPEDIDAVNEARPDFCGFVIGFPRSHRDVSPDGARRLRERLDDGIVPVGVSVDRPVEDVAALLTDGTISVAQLHGHEDAAYIARLRELVPGKTVWKAYRVRTAADLDAARGSTADLPLLDNGYGTGAAFDWSLIRGLGRPWILAGGLDSWNVGEAVRALRPWGVDLSSGVETDRVKDRDKILAAVEAVRRADPADL